LRRRRDDVAPPRRIMWRLKISRRRSISPIADVIGLVIGSSMVSFIRFPVKSLAMSSCEPPAGLRTDAFPPPLWVTAFTHLKSRMRIPSPACWGRWRRAPDGVWAGPSTEVGLHNRYREHATIHTCFPHPIRPSGPPSPLRGEGRTSGGPPGSVRWGRAGEGGRAKRLRLSRPEGQIGRVRETPHPCPTSQGGQLRCACRRSHLYAASQLRRV
jgi:hypothetical protein